MNKTQKRKIILLSGLIWLVTFILLGLSFVAYFNRPAKSVLLLLLLADFLSLSAAGTTVTVAFLAWRKKHKKQPQPSHAKNNLNK